jgi:hypothetical protein
MAVQTLSTTLAINPAFLQEIKDSNAELWETLERIRGLYEPRLTRAKTAHELVRLLDDLRDQLALQFSLEEAYGYLEVPTPERASGARAEHARRQHCALYLDLSELCERAEELQYRGLASEQLGLLIEETQSFEARLQAHEAIENQLIRSCR